MQRTRVAKEGDLEGYVWQSKVGHYCWEVRNDEGALAGGGGYDDPFEAELDLIDEYEEHRQRVKH